VIDSEGFRAGIAVIIVNDQKKLLWAKRIGQPAWQFPQGGMHEGETVEETMFRELKEEIGLSSSEVKIITSTPDWLRYHLPKRLLRHHSLPLCIGQKQKWFLLQLVGEEENIQFDHTETPEFDGWRWVNYWYPLKDVVNFKRNVYNEAMKYFAPYVFEGKVDP
jgi:putative (di)nucleoside polyphosphate hydrolase